MNYRSLLRGRPKFAILAGSIALLIGAALPAKAGEAIFTLNAGGTSIGQFDSTTVGTVTNRAVTGLVGADTLIAIDFRPATGQMYGLGAGSRIYTLTFNGGTITAAQVGTDGAFTLNGTSFGFDFNPTVDRIRLTSDAEQNLRLNPIDGTLTGTDGALNPGDPNIVGSAYTNSFPGATTTQLFNIDSVANTLLLQAPPNAGTLNTVGPLGVDVGNSLGFDISGLSGTAYLAANVGGTDGLYTVNLATGAATLQGVIGGSAGVAALSGAPLFWDGNGATAGIGGTGNWGSVANATENWTTSPAGTGPNFTWPNTALSDAIFAGTAGTVTVTSAGMQVRNMTFNVDGYTIDGAQSLLLAPNSVITVTSAADTATISTVLNGADGFTKGGAGTLVLTGANTLTGAVNVNDGTVGVNGGANTLGTGALTIGDGIGAQGSAIVRNLAGSKIGNTSMTILADGRWDLNGFGDTVDNIGGVAGSQLFLGTGAILAANTTVDTTFAGVISGSGTVSKVGAATWTLSGVNTFTGSISASSGILRAGVATQAFGVGAAVSVGGTGTLDLNGFSNTIGSLSAAVVGGTIDNSAAGAATLTITQTAFANYLGVIVNTGGALSIVKEGTNELVLQGNNTYTGLTTVNAGILGVGTNTALGSAAAGTVVNAGATVALRNATVTGETLQIAGTGSALNFGALAVNSFNTGTWNGAITLTGAATIGALDSATLNLNTAGGAGIDLNGSLLTLAATQGGGAASINVAGGGITGAGGILVNGATVAMNAANTYTGGTTIRSSANGTGILNANVANALPTANGRTNVIMDNAGTGSSVLGIGASQSIRTLTGAASSTVNLSAAQFLTIGNADAVTTATYAGALSGGGGVIKDGASTQIFSGASNYSGGTSVNGGRLITQNTSALGTGGVALTAGFLQPQGLLNVTGPVAWSGGAISLRLNTADLLNATAFNDGNGATTNVYEFDLSNVAAPGTFTVTTFGTQTGFVDGNSFSAVAFNSNTAVQGFFTLNLNSVQFTILGSTSTGAVIQNSAPVGTPTFADFIVNGPVTTGTPTENNTINSLTFQPNSSLQIFNTLFITSQQPVNLTGGSSLILGAPGGPQGNLSASQLNIAFNSTLSGNGTIFGNVVNGGTVSPGYSPGTITITGNYTQTSTGTLRIEIGGTDDGEFDLLRVGGTANLDGTLDLLRINGYRPKRGDKVTFLTAGRGVNGEFDRVNNAFETGTILEGEVVYHDHSVSLEIVRGSFEKFADRVDLTPNQHAVAEALDSVSNDEGNHKALLYLDERQLGHLPGDFDKIAPEELSSIFTITTALSQVQGTNLQRRNDDIRSGANGFSAAGLAINGQAPGYSGGIGFRTGAAGPSGDEVRDGKESKEMKTVVEEEKKWGVFLSGTGEWVDVDGDGNARGFDLTSGGFTVGLDYKVSPNFALGIAAGYSGTTADLTDDGRVWVNGGKLGLYATYFTGGFYVDGIVNAGYNSFDTKRSALQGAARGDTEGGELSVLIGTGYDWKIGALSIGPTATFQYTYAQMDGFTERGSLAPLDIASQDAESVRSAFGLKASYDWRIGGVMIKPELRAAWQHEYSDRRYDISASFAGGAGDGFVVRGPEIGRDSLLLGAGFAIQLSETCTTYFYYDGELGRDQYDRHSVSGGVRVAF